MKQMKTRSRSPEQRQGPGFLRRNKLAVGFLVFNLALVAVVKNFQHLVIYPAGKNGRYPHENPEGARLPSEVGLKYQNVTVEVEKDLHLRGWHVSCEQADRPTVVFYHQNAGNIGRRLDYISKLVAAAQVNVLIVAYRGYSYSDGHPSEAGLQQDGLAILKFAALNYGVRGLFAFGRSLGGAVAAYSVVHSDAQTLSAVRGLILENTFTSLEDVIKFKFGGIAQKLLGLLLGSFWPTVEIIERVKVPTLLIKTANDKLTPKEQMDRLGEKLSLVTELVLQKGEHVGSWALEPRYFPTWRSFVDQHLN